MSFDLQAPPDGFFDDPYPHYAALRDTPVLDQPDGSVLLSRHADLTRVYRDTDAFLSDKRDVFRPVFGDGPLYHHHTTSLVFNDPPLHNRVRRIMTGALTPRALDRMTPRLEALVDRLLDGLADGADLMTDFAGAIPVEVIGDLFDMPRTDRGPLRDWSLAILGALEPNPSPEVLARGNAAVIDFTAYLRDLTAHRRAHPGDPETDVLTRLMQGEGGALSEAELLQNCIFILNAGHETTTNLISNALEAIARHPDARAALLDDPALIETGIDEFLRFESPNQLGNRLTAEDVEFHGRIIRKGTNLHLVIGAANRDPKVFDAPDELRLDRRPNRHLAFAGGPHICVGLTLARMEGRIAVGRFLQRFPRYTIGDGADRSPRMRFRGWASLPVRLA